MLLPYAGDFELTLGHLKNSHFDNYLKCHVEILILVGASARPWLSTWDLFFSKIYWKAKQRLNSVC